MQRSFKVYLAHHTYRFGSTSVTEIPRDNETSSIQFLGMDPVVEKVSVPRRSHTHLGHGPFQRPEDSTTRAIARITRKLADVGYGLSKS